MVDPLGNRFTNKPKPESFGKLFETLFKDVTKTFLEELAPKGKSEAETKPEPESETSPNISEISAIRTREVAAENSRLRAEIHILEARVQTLTEEKSGNSGRYERISDLTVECARLKNDLASAEASLKATEKALSKIDSILDGVSYRYTAPPISFHLQNHYPSSVLDAFPRKADDKDGRKD